VKNVKYMGEDVVVKKGIEALLHALGPVEAIRFITMSKEKRIESVRRHREWQKSLDKKRFFDEIFAG